jgi:hypothetical protein
MKQNKISDDPKKINSSDKLKKTKPGKQADYDFNNLSESSNKKAENTINIAKDEICPYCGYPNPAGIKGCLNEDCDGHKQINSEFVKPLSKRPGTKNPYTESKKIKCFLKPISRKNEKEFRQIEFTSVGNKITLNRSNLDPDNTTISSLKHAELTLKNGKWIIANKSSTNTTFICLRESYELKKGDILLLGDRLFKFIC